MKDFQNGRYVFECDTCGNTLETGAREWGDAINALRDGGWTAVPTDDSLQDWQHRCPDCRFNKGRSRR